MSTTTIRFDPLLKKRLAKASRRTGATAHALIIEAVEKSLEELESDAEFHELADQRWASFLATGKTVTWEDGKAYLEALARGEKPRRPRARRWLRAVMGVPPHPDPLPEGEGTN